MSLGRKHFDDIEDFGDFDERIDAPADAEAQESTPNPLSWRRLIIEKAAFNVKKAVESKTDLAASYKRGSLVFDEAANKFGRVVESRPGFLNLTLLGGGKLIRQDVNNLDFIRKNRQRLTLPQMAKELFLSEIEVIGILNQLELSAEENKPQALPDIKKKIVVKGLAKAVLDQPVVKAILSGKTKLVAKTAVKEMVKESPKKKMAANKSHSSSVSFTKLLPKGATTDPVRDPNGYIQQNFLMMSNRELAVATGLSEHTIRRKLGEWNLKRKDFVNKV